MRFLFEFFSFIRKKKGENIKNLNQKKFLLYFSPEIRFYIRWYRVGGKIDTQDEGDDDIDCEETSFWKNIFPVLHDLDEEEEEGKENCGSFLVSSTASERWSEWMSDIDFASAEFLRGNWEWKNRFKHFFNNVRSFTFTNWSRSHNVRVQVERNIFTSHLSSVFYFSICDNSSWFYGRRCNVALPTFVWKCEWNVSAFKCSAGFYARVGMYVHMHYYTMYNLRVRYE